MEEVKTVNNKVLAFGIISLLAMFLIITSVLLVFLFITTSKLYDAQDRILEQSELINDLQKSLHIVTGRVSVYENFLIGTQASSIRRLVRKFLKEEKVKSTETNLEEFENWVYTKYNRSYEGMGG